VQGRFGSGKGLAVLAVPGRRLVLEGTMRKMCRRGPEPRVFFLFNDLLVYGSKTLTGSLKAQKVLPLETCTVSEEVCATARPPPVHGGLRIAGVPSPSPSMCSPSSFYTPSLPNTPVHPRTYPASHLTPLHPASHPTPLHLPHVHMCTASLMPLVQRVHSRLAGNHTGVIHRSACLSLGQRIIRVRDGGKGGAEMGGSGVECRGVKGRARVRVGC